MKGLKIKEWKKQFEKSSLIYLCERRRRRIVRVVACTNEQWPAAAVAVAVAVTVARVVFRRILILGRKLPKLRFFGRDKRKILLLHASPTNFAFCFGTISDDVILFLRGFASSIIRSVANLCTANYGKLHFSTFARPCNNNPDG